MPKQFNCAKCGIILHHTRKVCRGKIYDLIEPHTCDEEVAEPECGDGLTFLEAGIQGPEPNYNRFEFVQKINDLSAKQSEPQDRRAPEHIKDIKGDKNSSTAPGNLLDNLRTLPNQEPEREL